MNYDVIKNLQPGESVFMPEGTISKSYARNLSYILQESRDVDTIILRTPCFAFKNGKYEFTAKKAKARKKLLRQTPSRGHLFICI